MAEEVQGSDVANVQPDTLSAGIETREELNASVPALCVSWIRWDSGFRNSGLRANDRVVAVNGTRLQRPADAQALSKALPSMLGQYQEAQYWQQQGATDGQTLRLTVRRRNMPGDGWQELDVQGCLRLQRSWRNADNRPLMGPNGPQAGGYEGSDRNEAWSWWYENFRKLVERAWDENPFRGTSSPRQELKDLQDMGPRVALAQAQFPGAFSSALQQDYTWGVEALAGRSYTITEADLAWRVATDKLAEDIANAGMQARQQFLAAHAAELVDPFPAVDPVLGDRSKFAGKLVELPRASNRNWILQGLGSRIVFSDSYGGYSVDPDALPMQRALVARLRYERQVKPWVRDEYAIIGRVMPDPVFLLLGERGCFALEVEPVAVSIGDAFFVDVTQGEGERSAFAGEALVAASGLAPLPVDATPRQVLEAMFTALKVGDQRYWESLFATLSVSFAGEGPPLVRDIGLPRLDSTWEWTRRMLSNEVYDMQVVWCDDIKVVTTGQEYQGAPRIESVLMLADFVGRAEDGSYRSYMASGVQKWWYLQRVDQGPWRVLSGGGL